MLQTLNIVNELSERGVKLAFVRQSELSTLGPHTKLLLAIYSYFAETERDFISIRTKQRLAAVMKIINPQLEKPIIYNVYRYFVQHKEELLEAWKVQ